MSKEKINELINDIKKDYEKNGKGRPTSEWFLDAIKRKIVDIYYDDLNEEQKNAKVLEIANELKAGIQAFKENRDKVRIGESIMSEKLNSDQNTELNEAINSTVDSIKVDLIKIEDYKTKGVK